jgi:toxin CptA
MRSSNASAPCRFELRPSRWTTAALLALAVLAPFAALQSAMPRVAAWPLAAVAAILGLWLARREWRRPTLAVLIDGNGAVSVDGVAVEEFRIDWRGPLAFLSWRDRAGRRHRRGLWPDALGPALRRELRLLADRADAGRRRGGMAP